MLELRTTSLPVNYAETAVAIGKFDGVHLGHKQLIHELVQASEDQLLSATVLTFDKHPDAVLNPGTEPPTSVKRKLYKTDGKGLAGTITGAISSTDNKRKGFTVYNTHKGIGLHL